MFQPQTDRERRLFQLLKTSELRLYEQIKKVGGFNAVLDEIQVRLAALEKGAPDPIDPIDAFVFADEAEYLDAVARHGVSLGADDDYFRSDHWLTLRAELITGRCAMCSRTRIATTLHHVSYANLGNEQLGRDLVEVHHDCHNRYHAIGFKRAA